MSMLSVMGSVAPKLGRVALKAQKYSPEILLGVGVVGFGVTNILTAKATLKLEPILEEAKSDISSAKGLDSLVVSTASAVDDEDPSRHMERRVKVGTELDLIRLYIKHTARMVKVYTPSLIVGTITLAAFIGSHKIQSQRNVALMAAYQGVLTAHEKYKKQVQDRFGIEEEHNISRNLQELTKTEEATNEDGTKSDVEKVVYKVDAEHSPYARFFDETSTAWERDGQYNLVLLKSQESMFNDKLRARGHVFLNEVYDALGMRRSREGAVVGWVLGEGNNNHIDFGIYDLHDQNKRAFVNGLEKSILLDFNVDGVIFDKIDDKKSK